MIGYVLNHSTGIISLSLHNRYSTFNRNYNYMCQMYSPDVARADVNVLDNLISVRDGYKQYDLSNDEILLTI